VRAVSDLRRTLEHAAAIVAEYREAVGERPVAPPVGLDGMVAAIGGPLPEGPTPAIEVIDELVAGVDEGLVASAGPRYFGFVIGGSVDAAVAADVVAVGWDQCAFNATLSPAAAAAELVAGSWLKELLGLPPSASVGFVAGGQEANTVGLAAGRHHVLTEVGWDVERNGLALGPRVRVVAGSERHATIDRALRLLGFGTAVVEEVASGPNGAIDVEDLRRVLAAAPPGPTIVCLQAGNVNTGAVDDLRAGCEAARRHGAWVHVDGAFGLWAGASPTHRSLVDGVELADSWGVDGHKWLNVPYDSGFAFCAHPDAQSAAVSYTAAYLTGQGVGPPGTSDLTLSSSRRARGFATWAAIRQLGRTGVAELVDRCCANARRFAEGLAAGGATIANDVVLNQVLVDFGDDSRNDRIGAAVQADGTCWLGATTFGGRRLLRISVSNWSTTGDDVDRSVAAILRLADGQP
jgi:glutamate/tyrosine decarboxylase-like PLP-dependent enzyme